MKVAGIKMTDPWASRALRSKGVETERVASAPVETVVDMERVSFEHHGPEKNYRPLLHLTGVLRSIVPEEPLPFGIEEVSFRESQGPTMDAYYEFDDQQLAQLVSKGYFTEGFEPPATMAGIPWELPTTIDALILTPEFEGDTPVVFVTIHGQTELALDAQNSGYELTEYFENQLTPEAQAQATQKVREGVPTRSGEMNDLLAGHVFTEPEASHLRDAAEQYRGLAPDKAGDFPVVRTSIFEELMAEFEQQRALEAAEEAARPAQYDPESPEGVYHQRIAPGVDKALSLPGTGDTAPEASADTPEAEQDTSADSGTEPSAEQDNGLNLYDREDEELDVVPVAVIPKAADERWTPEADPLGNADTEAETGTDAGTAPDAADSSPAVTPQDNRSQSDQRKRARVQRTLEHEKAAADLEDTKDGSGPELG